MKRFIAGAVCPACGQRDSLFFKSEKTAKGQSTENDWVFCSRCDFSQQRGQSIDDDQENNKLEGEEEQNITWH